MTTYAIRRLGGDDLTSLRGLNRLFSDVFAMPETFQDRSPDDGYLNRLLVRDSFIAMVAEQDGAVIGGLTAYFLHKAEQARCEIYIYDLAVNADHRRQGIATRLIEGLKPIARAEGAWVIFVQSDKGDEVPTALYNKLGKQEDVHHFDIAVTPD